MHFQIFTIKYKVIKRVLDIFQSAFPPKFENVGFEMFDLFFLFLLKGNKNSKFQTWSIWKHLAFTTVSKLFSPTLNPSILRHNFQYILRY